MLRNFLLFLTCSFLLPLAVWAQVTTSNMNGFVLDENNEGLPAAGVKATHLPTGTVYNTITQAGGNFSIQNMRVGGPYRVEISYLGYEPKVVEGLHLVLGEAYSLTERLQVDAAEIEEITVTGHQNPILNSQRTGAATNISTETLERLPTISRSITDYTRLTPQANGNGFAGRDGRFNNTQIDGANFNNGFGLSSNALPGGDNQPVSLDAIEEIQINIAPYDVRQTGFTGAGINAITRSGTNQLKGSVYGFLRPKSFSGLHVGDNELDELDRTNSLVTGFRIGAPIIKNKLFIFGNFEYENATSAGNNWLAARDGLTGANVTRVRASDLESVRDYLMDNYDYDPGAYENYANNYANKNFKALLRLDWNINDKNTFTLRYNQMSGISQQGTNGNSGPNPRSSVQRISSESIAFENATYSFKNTIHSLTAELNSTLSPKLSNQLLGTFSRIQDARTTPNDQAFPFVDIWEDGKNYMSFGTELFSHNNDVINRNFSIIDNLTYTTGRHTITGGVSFQTMTYGNSYVRMGTSYYRYHSVQSFLNGNAPDVYGITYPFEGQDGYAKVRFGLAGIYLQDKIAVSPKLNITAGLRMDLPIFLDNPTRNPAVDTLTLLDKNGGTISYNTGAWPKSKPLFSPRVGFNFDAFGDRSLQVRGGTGIFTGNIPFVWFTNMPSNLGVLQTTFEPVDEDVLNDITHFSPDPMYWPNQLPQHFPTSPSDAIPSYVALIDRDFKMPQIWRSNLGVDYKLPKLPLIATLDVMYSKDVNAVYQYNANRKEADGSLNYSEDDRDFWNGSANARYNSATGNIIPVLSNTNKGHSFTTTLGLTLNEINGLSGSLYYTYTVAKDISGNPGSSANSAWSNNYSINDPNELLLGYSQYAVPHRLVGNLTYRVEYANHLASTFTLFYSGMNQGRYAYTYNGDINKDGVSLDLLYLPQNSGDLNFLDIENDDNEVVFSAEEQRTAFDAFVNNDPNLSKYRGDYVARNAGLMPWINRWDFRFLQDIFVHQKSGGRRHTLQLSLDIMNVGNLLSKDWGLYKQLNNGSGYNYDLLKVVDVSDGGVPSFNMITTKDADGKTILPTTPFRNLNSISNTWGMQIGVRYIF